MKISIIASVLLCCMCSHKASADIYMFIDSSGVINFTNIPTSSDYKLYIREKPEKIPDKEDTIRFDRLIRKASQKFGVDFPLIKAVIKIESNFNPRAVSSKGAKGLMQIMPQNFKKLYVSDPFNPSQNIMAGTLHLKKLMQRYNGKLPIALAAYNAGVSVVDRYRAIPPFRETENYVRKVMKLYNTYKE